MRRRIAVFANGWGTEYLQQVGRGILRRAKETDTDVFAFVNFSSYSDNSGENKGESDIFHLPKMEDFDGAIFLTNSFNLQGEIDFLQAELLRTKIPAVSLEIPMEGAHFVETDNRSGLLELTRHLIQAHNVENIVFVGGYREHKENTERLSAILEAASEFGVVIPEENVLYGDWSKSSGGRCIGRWMDTQGDCPDAVICANDLMAMGVCEWFSEHGYDVPKDVKVTGYDNLQQGMEYWPALTSISQEWEQMGYDSAMILDRLWENKEAPEHLHVKTKTVFRESCGCKKGYQVTGFVRTQNSTRVDGLATDQHFRHLYMAVRKNKNAKDLNGSLTQYYKKEGWMEGRDFMVCLLPDFFSGEDHNGALQAIGYPEQMALACSLNNGVPEPYQLIPTESTVFKASLQKAEAGVYIFVPIHSEEKAYGFAVLTRDFEISADNLLYIWTRHMRQYMEQVYSNIQIDALTQKLSRLSVTDILTGLYNRTGCEQIIYPQMKEVQAAGKQGIIMLADVDRLKIINDTFGHDYGDKALQLASEALKRALPEGFKAARFGGDEFLIAGTYDGEKTPVDLSKLIYKELSKLVKEEKLPFVMTISIGGIILKVGENFNIMECIQKADKNMYDVKERHHQGLL